jgi:hypothetical protein
MSPGPARKNDVAETSRLIRRAIGTEGNARFLQRLPLFKTDHRLSEEMLEMLDRLDDAERTRPD